MKSHSLSGPWHPLFICIEIFIGTGGIYNRYVSHSGRPAGGGNLGGLSLRHHCTHSVSSSPGKRFLRTHCRQGPVLRDQKLGTDLREERKMEKGWGAVVFIECLLCARHFTHTVFLNSHKSPMSPGEMKKVRPREVE